MNNPTNVEGLSKQEEKLEKARANVIKIVQTRFKKVPDEVIQAIKAIDDESLLEKLFTNSIIVADLEDFQKVVKGVVSRK
ncbi:hypothetical protein [Calothrix sp. CCY 0018]|uniref:hypothetical protein n=1 Tax=Calothrix sp. CCY 0018 TaxID=3103864 RepID=UPI0039C6F9AE